MTMTSVDHTRIMALLTALGSAVLLWMGNQFGKLPQKVTILETKEVIMSQRLEKIDLKLDRILERLPHR